MRTHEGTGWITLLRKELLRFWKVSFQTIAAPVLTSLLYLLVFAHVLESHVAVYDGAVGYTANLRSGTISEVIRSLREEMSRVMAEDYVRTARAKGASVWRHAFKEGLLLPATEIIAAKIPFILGGAVIVEQIFNWPGMGRMAWQAAQDRDFPVIMGIALVAAAFVRVGSLIQRIVCTAVNPQGACDWAENLS